MCADKQKWLIVGISGVTNGGKTVLAQHLHASIPNSKLIQQDNYFYDIDSPHHVYLPELGHNNWEILSSLDNERFFNDILEIIGEERIPELIKVPQTQIADPNGVSTLIESLNSRRVNVLIIEGFLIFNYKPVEELCHLKYYLILNKDLCRDRRNKRVYDPPDVPGYFDAVVWPEYEKSYAEVQKNKNVVILRGDVPTKDHLDRIVNDCNSILVSKSKS